MAPGGLRKLGSLSTEEQADGLRELGRTRSYVDLSRVGIWGWSGGRHEHLERALQKAGISITSASPSCRSHKQICTARATRRSSCRTPEENPEEIPRRRSALLCRRVEGAPPHRARLGRDQHPYSDRRASGESAHRARQAVRVHVVPQPQSWDEGRRRDPAASLPAHVTLLARASPARGAVTSMIRTFHLLP